MTQWRGRRLNVARGRNGEVHLRLHLPELVGGSVGDERGLFPLAEHSDSIDDVIKACAIGRGGLQLLCRGGVIEPDAA
eukprot:515724-Pyramimonas_sp.AAC.1